MRPLAQPIPLAGEHEVASFDCGSAALNEFLHKHALQGQSSGSSRTFVALDGGRVIGFYSLAAGSLLYESAPERVRKGLARHPIPVVLMARFGVDVRWQGKGLGKGLFVDALRRTLTISADAGVRAFVTHAKDEQAKEWYMKFGMEPVPAQPLHLYLMLKDVRVLLTR